MHTNSHSTASDTAAARSVAVARLMSVRELHRQRRREEAAAQGVAQGQSAYLRITKAHPLATMLILAGAA